MALFDDELGTMAESQRKMRLGRSVTFGVLGMLILLAIIRVIVLVFHPHSWLAMHFFNW